MYIYIYIYIYTHTDVAEVAAGQVQEHIGAHLGPRGLLFFSFVIYIIICYFLFFSFYIFSNIIFILFSFFPPANLC